MIKENGRRKNSTRYEKGAGGVDVKECQRIRVTLKKEQKDRRGKTGVKR